MGFPLPLQSPFQCHTNQALSNKRCEAGCREREAGAGRGRGNSNEGSRGETRVGNEKYLLSSLDLVKFENRCQNKK